LIDDYFQSLLAILAASPIVRTPDVSFEKRSAFIGFVRGNVYFDDGSLLHFRELINLQLSNQPASYVYHYQRADHSLVFRYDNSPHFPELSNFPNHKHSHIESTVASAIAPDLKTVLDEIESLLK